MNKKFLKCLSAILILFFHFWILLTSWKIESFIRLTAYIGVDIFFFLSANSFAGRKTEYKSFIKNRFITIYGEFVVFTLISAVYKKWSFNKILMILTGIEFFNKGGGSFLWFIPAIMIFYLLFPFFHNWNNKYKGWILLAIWFVSGVLITQFTSHKALFIFLNRIPVILAGYYYNRIDLKKNAGVKMAVTFVTGLVLLYVFGYVAKLRAPIYDLFYVSAVPFIVALVMISSKIKTGKITEAISSCTLEIYGLQMIFGFNLASKLLSMTKSSVFTNIAVMVILILAAYVMHILFSRTLFKLAKK